MQPAIGSNFHIPATVIVVEFGALLRLAAWQLPGEEAGRVQAALTGAANGERIRGAVAAREGL